MGCGVRRRQMGADLSVIRRNVEKYWSYWLGNTFGNLPFLLGTGLALRWGLLVMRRLGRKLDGWDESSLIKQGDPEWTGTESVRFRAHLRRTSHALTLVVPFQGESTPRS